MAKASGVLLIYHKPGIWNFGRIGKFVQNPFFKLTRNYHSNDISTDKNLVSDVSNFLIKNKNNFKECYHEATKNWCCRLWNRALHLLRLLVRRAIKQIGLAREKKQRRVIPIASKKAN